MQCASKFHRSYLHSEIFSHIACQSPGMSADQKKLANSLRARKSHVTSCGKHLQEALQEAKTKNLVSRSLSLALFWLTRPLLGSQRRCHAAALYPALLPRHRMDREARSQALAQSRRQEEAFIMSLMNAAPPATPN